MQYNAAQRRAVEHKEGPMLVLAGPGSGKTAVITGRTAQLIQGGVDPAHILVVTFTRAAATEMKSRFLAATRQSATPVTFGTFHGVFYGILKQAYHIGGSNILADGKKLQLLKELIRHLYKEGAEEAELPEKTAREISQVKSARMQVNDFYSGVLPGEVFREVYRQYDAWKRQNRLLDFDDIITGCYQLLSERADIRQRWQQKFQYILVDEFQDISPLQYDTVRLLAAPQNNLFIVGDDDQSIYRFRGASPDLMLHFPKDYPTAAQVTLAENYRSTPQILAGAGKLIAHNKKRFPKEIRATAPPGEPIDVRVFANPREECKTLAELVRKANGQGVPFEDMAVLFRTNLGCREAVEQFMAYQIPFRLRDALPCVFDHWIAKDLFAYLHLGSGAGGRAEFLRIYNRPNRYFSREAFSDPKVKLDDLYAYYEDKAWMQERVEQLEADLAMVGNLPPFAALLYIRNEIGYGTYLKEYARDRSIPAEELLQVMDELQESAKQYRSLTAWEAFIAAYREKLAEQAAQRQEEARGVNIATLHASKGMEYRSVYILDVNEGVMPYRKAVLDADKEEERRMFYVGMTRAKRDLHLFSVRERYDKMLAPSPYLKELF